MSPSRREHAAGVLAKLDGAPAAPYLAVLGTLVAGTWLVTAFVGGGELSVWNHLFYIPIVLAALRFGPRYGGGLGFFCGLLAGPLSGHLAPAVVLPRTLLFSVVGLVVGALAASRARAASREREVVEREAALYAQRAALVQLVSHEFRTPLTIIRGTLETLGRREGAVAAPFDELLRAADRSVDRLQEMLDVVLAAADEVDEGRTPQVVVDPEQLVVHAAASLRPELPGRLHLDVHDRVRLVTIEPYLWLTLRCLLDNAAKFSPAGSAIDVTVRARSPMVEIAITDRGPGLPEGFEGAAFEPFTQADPSTRRRHPGLGMGLYTARRLGRRLGGDVTVASTSAGTTATVVLPQRRKGEIGGGPGAGDEVVARGRVAVGCGGAGRS